jgi:Flp pilus assembly protein TadD
MDPENAPPVVRDRRQRATYEDWRGRADMMAKSDAYSMAYDDYVKALKLNPLDSASLRAFTRTAVLTGRAQDALSWVKSLTMDKTSADVQIAISKLLAAAGLKNDAIQVAKDACTGAAGEAGAPSHGEERAGACEQLASLHADAGDAASLDPVVQTLRDIAPDTAGTHYYAAAAAFLHGNAQSALEEAQKAIGIDASYAAAYDMAGAAHTKLGQADRAAQAFQTSLRFDPHDSTAYTNLGLLALTAGNRAEAVNYFAEALWLTPDNDAARRGLADAKSRLP